MDDQLLATTISRAREGFYIGKSEWLPVLEVVQAEVARIKALNRVADRAVQVAAEAIHAALNGEPHGLVGRPHADADAAEWTGFFYQRAAFILASEGVET